MELRPDEATFDRIATFFKVDNRQLMQEMSILGLFENLIGRVDGNTFRSNNGLEFSYDARKKRIDNSVVIQKIVGDVIHISGFPLQQRQRDQLEAALNPKGDVSLWLNLPRDVFIQLVETNGIRGKDLVSLCVSNPQINQKCNANGGELFRRLLRRDYGIESQENHREKYVEMSKAHVWIFGGARVIEGIAPEIPRMAKHSENAKQVSIGPSHYAFINFDGQLYTWGSSGNGRLGRDRKLLNLPVGDFRGLKQVSCGYAHTAILDSQGRIWTFGDNDSGQLGLGDVDPREVPTMIEGFEGIK